MPFVQLETTFLFAHAWKGLKVIHTTNAIAMNAFWILTAPQTWHVRIANVRILVNVQLMRNVQFKAM